MSGYLALPLAIIFVALSMYPVASLADPCATVEMDLMFVNDESTSVGSSNYQLTLQFMVDVTTAFQSAIEAGTARVGVVAWSGSQRYPVPMQQYTFSSLSSQILGISYERGSTSMAAAITYSTSKINNDGREGVQKIMIVINDGDSGDDVESAANAARAAGITVIGVGVNGYTELEILQVAGCVSASDCDLAFMKDDFTDMTDVVTSVSTLACTGGEYPPPMTCTDQVVIYLSEDFHSVFTTDLDGDAENSKWYVSSEEKDYSEYDAMDDVCKGVGTSTEYSATFDLGECDPYVTANDTYINYQYKLWNKPMLIENGNPAIARYEIRSFRFDCIYSRVVTDETTSSWIVPNIVKTHIWDGTSMYEGTFTFSLSFTDSSYGTAVASGTTIDIDEWMYLALELDDGSADSSNHIAFKDCFAKNAASTGTLTYTLIENYAVKNEGWDQDGSIIMEVSGTTQRAQMKVKSFVWNNAADPTSMKIYVQCDATVCNDDVSGNCLDYVDNGSYAATNRRRRKRRDTGSQQVVTLMAGPMEVN